jgi:hypothetical protein
VLITQEPNQGKSKRIAQAGNFKLATFPGLKEV